MHSSLPILAFLEKSIKGDLSVEEQVAFLDSVEINSAQELATIVRFLMQKSTFRPVLPDAIDFCGTGGSGLSRMNISTPVAFLLAAGGVKVAKHGNRASSGRFGSFDLLESLGVNFNKTEAECEEIFNSTGLVFLFAQNCHPVMKHFANARKRIGRPTFFNLLGPLLNPSNLKKQVIGTAFPDKAHLMIETCRLLNKEHVFVIHGMDGLDKMTLTGPSKILELKNGKIKEYELSPEEFGITPTAFEEISGGPSENPEYIRAFIEGKLFGPRKDLLCLNAAFGFLLAGKAKTLFDAFQIASKVAESGKVKTYFEHYIVFNKIPSILSKIIVEKKKEVQIRKRDRPLKGFRDDLKQSNRDFRYTLFNKKKNLIAEIKPASPSEGDMEGSRISIAHRARIYENEKVAAISVLTDEKFFKGSLENLKVARSATNRTPLLCKDFIVDEYQIFEARYFGADVILLIAAVLSVNEMNHFLEVAKSLNMDAIFEVHNEEELSKVLKTKAEIIGINNRNLNDFSIDLNTTYRLSKKVPDDKIIISESGIYSRLDIEKLTDRTNAVLIGTVLMKTNAIPQTIHELTGHRPFLKICGIQSIEELECCAENGIDFVGLNFVPSSKRFLDPSKNNPLFTASTTCLKVGIFQNQAIEEVNEIASKFDLDYIQLSGKESIKYVQSCVRPVIKSVTVKSEHDLKKSRKYIPFVAYLLVDGKKPGSGKTFDHSLLKTFDYPFLLAGGIGLDNIDYILKEVKPYFVDLASGVEIDGLRSLEKIVQIKEKITMLL